KAGSDGAAVLSVSGLSGDGFEDLSFSVRRGEIVGLAGIAGNGQGDVLRALAGLTRFTGHARFAGGRAGRRAGGRRGLSVRGPPRRGPRDAAVGAGERGVVGTAGVRGPGVVN